MILVCGGMKGGAGKTTLATNLVVWRARDGRDVLLVDADGQASASDFTVARNQTYSESGAGYTSIKLHGPAVRTDTLRLAPKYDDVIIDVGGRDTAGQRAALSIADVCVVPCLPSSFDLWALEQVAQLVAEARAFNDRLQVYCVLNRADSVGKDNAEAAAIAEAIPGLSFLDAPLGNRKVCSKRCRSRSLCL